MNKLAKIGIAVWTILCFLGACSGMISVADKTNGHMSDAEAAGAGIGLFVWLLIWFFPTAGLGIIALATRPKSQAVALSPKSEVTTLCSDCGKYFAGTARFCPLCGKAQTI